MPLAAAHQRAHRAPPAAATRSDSTTDARFYLNEFAVPAVCYGPRAVDIHGIDEHVELRSIVDGAKTLVRFLDDFYRERRRDDCGKYRRPTTSGGRLLPLDRRNAAQQIADRVVTAIALGEFVEGQRLPAERELARMLGTARPTIREALQRLESQGFVAIHRGAQRRRLRACRSTGRRRVTRCARRCCRPGPSSRCCSTSAP